MKYNNCAFIFRKFTLCLILSILFTTSDAALSTLYPEELCYSYNIYKIDLKYQKSAIIASVPNGAVDCSIKLQTERGSSVVISFYQYMLQHDDILEFQDASNFRLSLTGDGVYIDERKSLVFEGPLTIRYVTNSTFTSHRQKFNLVYTQVHDAPCYFNEFKCKNNKCIPKDLQCDRHNHCGDMSEQKDCGSRNIVEEDTFEPRILSRSKYVMIFAITISTLLGIILIILTAVFIRTLVLRKRKTNQGHVPTVFGATNMQQPSAPTFFGRIRHSFRSIRNFRTAEPPTSTLPGNASANYEVPTIYSDIRSSKTHETSTTAPPGNSSGNCEIPSMYPQMRNSETHETPTATLPGNASANCEVPSMYPKLPSAPRMSGTDNPEFKSDEEN